MNNNAHRERLFGGAALLLLWCLPSCDHARISMGSGGGAGRVLIGGTGGGGGVTVDAAGGNMGGSFAGSAGGNPGTSVGGGSPTGGGAPGGGGSGSPTGTGGVGGGGAVTPEVEACNQLTTTLCTSGVQCIAATNETVCESQLRLEFDCAQAAGVNFSTCNQDARSSTCTDAFPSGDLTAPTSCLAPVNQISLSDAQSKCYVLVDLLCTHGILCSGRTPNGSDVQDCEDDVTTNLVDGFPCLLATAVGPGYSACIAAVPTIACDTVGGGGIGGGGVTGAGGAGIGGVGGAGVGGAGGGAGTGIGGAAGGVSTNAISACADALIFSP